MFQKPIEIMERNPQSVLKPQTPIRPYVCSTIKDFQEERDFLANNIFPQLNELCNSRGTYFKAIDLRWPASEAHDPLCPNFHRQYCSLQSQQLKLCLDYINNSFPFFLCMLGQTYGEFLREDANFLPTGTPDLPGLSKVEKNLYVAAHNGYPWVLENFTCSLTELEVIQAAFMNASQFQYYYFRTGAMLLKALEQEKGKITCPLSRQKEYEKRRIGELKAKIISKGLPVRFYRDLHELGELVFKDWLTVIEKLYPASCLPENLDYEHNFERSYHEAFTAKCRKMFILSKESKQVFDALEKFVMKDPQNEAGKQESGNSLESVLRIRSIVPTKSILLLSGERGCGKSTLIASWVNSYRERNPDTLVIPYYVGSSCDHSDIMSVMHYFITELQYQQFGTQIETDLINEDSKVWVFSLLVEIFLASISLKPCILVLDGIEELIGVYGISGQKAKDFSWLPPTISTNCKFIMSTVSSSLSYKSLCARSDVKTVELTVASDENTVIKIFEQYLTVPHKNIFSYREKHNSRKKPCLSPLKVAVLANEFQECRLYRNESECIQEYLEVLSIQELWELILKRWVEDYSWIIKPKKVVSAVPDTKSQLNCKISDFATNEKCQLICFVARFLNYLGRTNDAEELLITAEDLMIKHDLESEILFKVQLSLGELYLEIGSLQKAFYFFQRAWVTWRQLTPSGLHNLERLKQKGRVLHNLAKTMSQGSVKENHLLENTVDLSKQLTCSPYDFAMLKCTEGILKSLGGNFSIAKLKFQECLSIRKSLFGENHFLVGEIKEYLADLISGHKKTEKYQRKNAVDYYRGVINIKENMELLTNSFQVKKQLNISLSNVMCKLVGQLIKIDSSSQSEQEATGFLHRALDLRVTYLGPSHSSTCELLRLLRELERKGQNQGSLQGRSSSHESFKGILVQEKISKRRLEYHRPQNLSTLKSPLSSSAAKLQRAMSLDSYKVSEDSSSKSLLGKGQKSTRFITCSPTKEIIKQQVQNNVEIWSCREDNTVSKKEKDASGKNTAFSSPENMFKSPREIAPYNWSPQTPVPGPFNTMGSLEIPCRPQTSPEDQLFQKSGRHTTFHKPSPPKRQQTDMRLLKKLSENNKQ
ncbi:putative tetratricopeptide repeat protein 41 isoform X5 [Notamacropus eugenii]|uniref:putative tetratricopeptide repeat protein 41 isoform X5 n=1 Tax=Notamacropus eugenii TaxID=9315 RepID=UPI003B671135